MKIKDLLLLVPRLTDKIVYLFNDEFTTALGAGSFNGTAAEPGPGTRTAVENDGQFSISGGKLVLPAQVTAVFGDLVARTTDAFSRKAGRCVTATINLDSVFTFWWFGWLDADNTVRSAFSSQSSSTLHMSEDPSYFGNSVQVGTIAATTDYQLVIIQRTTGAFYFIKGGAFTEWTLVAVGVVDADASTPAGYWGWSGTGTLDNLRVVDLGAPLNNDYEIAVVDTQTFTQSLGAELLTNPGPTFTFTGDNPDGWTVTGESGGDPAVSEVGTTEDHTGVGTGSINVYTTSSAINARQAVVTVGKCYEVKAVVSYVTGNLGISDQTGLRPYPASYLTAAGSYSWTGYAGATNFYLINSGAVDGTVDSVSLKEITMNDELTAVADGVFDLSFTLPGSPLPSEGVDLLYRANGADNCWLARVRRNLNGLAWDFYLYSISNGTFTQRASATGVGTPTRIRVITNGSNHDCYTLEGTTWTKRGSTVTNTTHATNKGVRAVYSSTVTPLRLTAWPRVSSDFDVITTGTGGTLPTYAETSAFTQSLGSELATNNSFDNWTGDNPDNWTIDGEVASDPMVTQVASGGGAGTGSARLYSSATSNKPEVITGTIITANTWNEARLVMSARSSGSLLMLPSTGTVSTTANIIGTTTKMWREGGVDTSWRFRVSSAPTDITVDSVTIKRVTLNSQLTSTANGAAEFYFTLPVSPAYGDRAELWYRAHASTGDLDYWAAYVQFINSVSGWSFYLDRVSSGTPTNLFSVASLGITPQGIRIETNGNNHNVFVYDGSIWIKMGTTVSNATHASNTGVRAVYASTVTPTLLRYTV